jgi:hypothetical protein
MESQNSARIPASLRRPSQPYINVLKKHEFQLDTGHRSPALGLTDQPQTGSPSCSSKQSRLNLSGYSVSQERHRAVTLPESNNACNRFTSGALFTLFPNSNSEKALTSRFKKTIPAKRLTSGKKARHGVGQVMAVNRNRLVYIAKNNETPSAIASTLGIDCDTLLYENVQVFGPKFCKNSKLRECTQVRLPIQIKQQETQNDVPSVPSAGSVASSDPDGSNGRLMIVIKTDDHRSEQIFPPASARIVDTHVRPSKKIEEEADAVSTATSDPDAADALKALMMLTRAPARPSQPNIPAEMSNTDAPAIPMQMNGNSGIYNARTDEPSSASRPSNSASNADIGVIPAAPTVPQNPSIHPSSSPPQESIPTDANSNSTASPSKPKSCAQCLANAQESAKGITRNRYVGVTFHRKTKMWWSFIRVDSRLKHIGDFKSEFEAAVAYDEHAARLGKALNHPKPPAACSQCGKAEQIVFRNSQAAPSLPPMPKTISSDKTSKTDPEKASPVPASMTIRTCDVNITEKIKDDSENTSSTPHVSVTQMPCSIEKQCRSFQPMPPPVAKFFALRSDRVKKLYRIIGREGAHVKVEAISGPASISGKFCRASTPSAPNWVNVSDVLEFFPKVEKSPVPVPVPVPVPKRMSPQIRSNLVWPPNVDSKSAREILTSYLQARNLNSRLAAAKPFVQRMAPFNEREMSIIKRGFVSGLVSGASNLRLFAKYFPSRRSTRMKDARLSTNRPEPTADDVEMEAIGEESTALMRAPLREDNGTTSDSPPSSSFDEIYFSSAQGTSSFGFTPVAKKMRIGIEREDNPESASGDRPGESEILQLDDGDLEGIFFE